VAQWVVPKCQGVDISGVSLNTDAGGHGNAALQAEDSRDWQNPALSVKSSVEGAHKNTSRIRVHFIPLPRNAPLTPMVSSNAADNARHISFFIVSSSLDLRLLRNKRGKTVAKGGTG